MVRTSRRVTLGLLAGALPAAALGLLAAVLPATAFASAQATPVGCFGFDKATGTIDAYLPHAAPENTEPCPTDVVIPSRIDGIAVTTIGDAAFSGSVVTSVEIPNGVTTIGATAFGWLGLTELDLPRSVASIGYSAFRGNALTDLVLPDTVTELGESAFAYNPLRTLTIGAGITHLSTSVFEGGELEELHIPSTVTSMDASAFHSNPLRKVTIGEADYDGKAVLDIPASAFQYGMLAGDGITELHLGSNVASVGSFAFFGTPLSDSVVIAEGLTTIGNSAFRGARIGELTLPASTRTIGAQAFWDAGLTAIDLPDGLATVGNAALGENELSEVTLPDSIEELGDGVLQQNETLETIHFGTDDYTGDPRWDLTGFNASSFGNDGLRKVTFGPVVRSIGDGAFAHNRLTHVDIPGSVSSVGVRAFDGGGIEKVTVAKGVKAIKAEAFRHNPVIEATIAGNPALDESAFAFNVDPADAPSADNSDALASFYNETGRYVQLFATDQDFIAKHSPGHVETTMPETGKDAGVALYGFVVNPVTYTVTFVDAATGGELKAPLSSGVGEGLDDYTLIANPKGDLDRYYRAGQKVELAATDVDGYATPGGRTMVLEAGENDVVFKYERTTATDGQASADSVAGSEGDTERAPSSPAAKPTPADSEPSESEDQGTVDPVPAISISVAVVLGVVALIALASRIRLRRNE